MGQTAETITGTAARGIGLAGMLLKDVTPEMFARLPVQDGARVMTNHPAFALGHLSVYPSRVFILAGRDPEEVSLPDEQEELFKIGAVCVDDPDGAIYPPMAEVGQGFQHGYAAALQLVMGLDDETLGGPHQGGEAYQKMFPTLGVATNFLLNSHLMMHLGQVSAWRRFMGLGSAM